MDARTAALAVGSIRTAVGSALVLAPGLAGRIWVGPGADGHGSRVFARVIGARDLYLGLRLLDATQKGRPSHELLRMGVVADLADAAATALTARHLTPARRVAMPLIAAGVGVVGGLAVAAAEATDVEELAVPEGEGPDARPVATPVGAPLGEALAAGLPMSGPPGAATDDEAIDLRSAPGGFGAPSRPAR